jgi:mono/diheme cytochrome c family protein
MTTRAAILTLLLAGPARAVDPAEATFEKEIRPLLVAECQRCHGPKKQHGGLRLDTREAALKGGETGPAVVPGDPAKSLLLKAVRRHGDLAMPPDKTLTPAQVEALAAWVKAGAVWPATATAAGLRSGPPTDREKRFWSFQPVTEPKPPVPCDAGWPANDIDRFVLADLDRAGLKPVADADRRTLLRRVTFDLTGLPPTPEEIAAFEKDSSPGAFEAVVTRLLASPGYGERWGRHWLDVVRYADTAGDGADYPVREAYKYRDYVIASLNADKPFDQFVKEQIAGDILAREQAAAGTISDERYAELVTATGYLAITRRYGYDLKPDFRHLDLADAIDNLGQTFLGLSVGCARCHDHKFDPVTMGDYYALYGILESTAFAFPGGEELKRPRQFPPLVPPAEAARLDKLRQAELAKLAEEIQRAERDVAAGKAAVVVGGGLAALDLGERQARLDAARRARDRLAETPPYPVAYGVAEGTPADARIQKRGEPDRPGEVVPRRFLELLGGEPIADPKGSGRRDLADWLTRPTNPLTARVIVNRVWAHHFGRGLVATPNDFGTRGDPPSHPALLDFLAARFVANGWSLKWLHRQIVLSRTYRLASADDPTCRAKDPDNRLLWQFRRQPLDAESIRDAILAISGKLVRGSPGPHPFPDVNTWAFRIHEPFVAVYPTDRRSVYVMVQRIRRHPFLGTFDGADPNASTPDRKPTTTPLQALYLLNNEFVHEQSDAFAGRLLAAAGTDADRVRLAYELTTGRAPDAADTRKALDFLKAYSAKTTDRAALAALGRVLFSSNGFLFVD